MNEEKKKGIEKYTVPIILNPRKINGSFYWLIPKDYYKNGVVPIDKKVLAYVEVDQGKY
jgi:hypothetical protein